MVSQAQDIEVHMFASSWTMTVFSTFKTFGWCVLVHWCGVIPKTSMQLMVVEFVGARKTVCSVWDFFIADGWVAFFQIFAGLMLYQHMELTGRQQASSV